MVEYRPIPDEDRGVFHEYTSYAFNASDGPPEVDPDSIPERWRFGEMRGVYPDDGAEKGADRSGTAAPLSVCKHHWFEARVRGEAHSAPGLAAVATPPENRRRGYVRDLLEGSLAEYRDRGALFSQLWAFDYGFYRQYGWDVGHERHRYECDPAELSFAAGRGDRGTYRAVDADEYELLEPVYEASLGGYDASLVRTPEWWRERVFTGGGTDPFVYAWERDGEVRGYLVYHVDSDDGTATLRVDELGYVDREAALALLAFCYDHDSQVDAVRFSVPADSRLRDLFADPAAVDCERRLGAMVRIVDVAAALSSLSLPSVDEPLVISVEDSLGEWNDGAFELASADGSTPRAGGPDPDAVSCEPTTADPDARIDVAALSQLAVGYRTASDLAWAGRLETGTDGVVDALERVFPPRATYLPDGF